MAFVFFFFFFFLENGLRLGGRFILLVFFSITSELLWERILGFGLYLSIASVIVTCDCFNVWDLQLCLGCL